MNAVELSGWDRLRHGGLLLDPQRLREISQYQPTSLSPYHERELRRQASKILDDTGDVSKFVAFVMETICGFTSTTGSWQRGSAIKAEMGRVIVTGETVKPRHLWCGSRGSKLPVFLDREKRVGIGRGRRATSQVLQWLRGGNEQLALLTNGRQWRLIFAGLDFDAWCEWDLDLWFEEGEISPQVTAFRTLLSPVLWTPPEKDAAAPLLQAIRDSRKGQAELSQILGERVREAVELIVQGHGEVLKERCSGIDPAEIYRAAVRVVMRLVVVLFAESRELLPRDTAFYHGAYGLSGLLEELELSAARGGNRLARSYRAWPRILALFRLVHDGSHHPDLPVPEYGGALFAAGDPGSTSGLAQALAVFESACFDRELMADRDVYRVLERITRTRVKVRQGRSRTWVPIPVDFSDLSSEYIGILYEGLLDFELRTAPAGDPVAFLAVGNQPALPLSRLEEMDDKVLANLLEKMKDTSGDGESDEAAAEEEADHPQGTDESDDEEEDNEATSAEKNEAADGDERHAIRTRAEVWARRAVQVGKLVPKPCGRLTPEKRNAHEDAIARKARQLVSRVVLPGEWYLVRWGGTRKGSGTFYTRPGLAVPTVQRTLRPLAWSPPKNEKGEPDHDAGVAQWTPRTPEEILALQIVDPACGSGTFPVAALRFLTNALYASLHHHGRIREDGDKSVIALLTGPANGEVAAETLCEELLPCRPEDPVFEARLKAILLRHVVERCIYGVDLDAIAVELCRLALWVETMDRTLPFTFLDHKIKHGNALVGAWFDQFQHYPVMAWKNREGGDKNHGNGVHFEKNSRTKKISAFVKESLTPDLRRFLGGRTLFSEDLLESATAVHDEALAVLARLHELPVQDAAERARIYRHELLDSEAHRSLKDAMDLWCACWFWPPDEIEQAPLPTTVASPQPETQAIADRIATAKHFFHWELEFPDVFREAGSGFDAVLGNPPWENLQPNPEEFFSNRDPLFRSYGRLIKHEQQRQLFSDDTRFESEWLDYSADFNSLSHWVSHSADPFGDPENETGSTGTFALGRGGKELHTRWRKARKLTRGYAAPHHPFRYQMGRIFTYRLFLEQCHALLRDGGRLGQIVPSGLYSDSWAQPLRELLLERCRWEWLFGFENREKIFDTHRSSKFNPVIVERGGRTEAIRTAFMRRRLEDWERAEDVATPYTLSQVERFSPRSRAILEIESALELEMLEKIYGNSVLLGDDGSEGWGIRFRLEFMMNTDVRLFPPRPKWEEKGYRPDEYCRWLRGDWRPIEELGAKLGVAPSGAHSVEIELEDWLFDTTAGPERRKAEEQFVHGHLLRAGDVTRTNFRQRCSQPPYDGLPVPRAEIPGGIVLSRESDAWIDSESLPDETFCDANGNPLSITIGRGKKAIKLPIRGPAIAQPLYEGRMIGQLDFSDKGWVSGKGRGAVWRPIAWERKTVEPQFVMGDRTAELAELARYLEEVRKSQGVEAFDAEVDRLRVQDGAPNFDRTPGLRVSFMDVTSATNERTMIASIAGLEPYGNSAPVLSVARQQANLVVAVLNSFAYDYVARARCSGLHLNWFVIEESVLPRVNERPAACLADLARRLTCCSEKYAWAWPWPESLASWRSMWALTIQERLRLRASLEAAIAALFGLTHIELRQILTDCDHPTSVSCSDRATRNFSPRGFWRVDKEKDPELRYTVLSLVAFQDLDEKIRAAGGDQEKGIEAFLSQNRGEGWLLPEMLCLADHGLGHDERAKHPQPVASRLGPRFYDWQLVQSTEDSWRECHLHSRNLLGEAGYQKLLTDIEAERSGESPPVTTTSAQTVVAEPRNRGLFD